MAALIHIGNSRGVRIPKEIIERAKLNDRELEFKVLDEGLLIRPVEHPRQGWKEQFDNLPKHMIELTASEREWLDSELMENEEWEW